MKRKAATELHIGKDVIPEGRELSPGDFGLSENRLDQMEKAGQVAALRQRQTSKKAEEEDESE